ncbi:MAG: hypothetical protein OEQ18_00215 [Gammaproteobacteria bacterium]|nr:hypothetical protein [Gammaproteobacteria bacterium]
MQAMLQHAIREMDVGLSCDDFDALAELDALAKECAAPQPSDLTSAVLDYPVEIGGVKFRALTIAARIWARDIGIPATKGDPMISSLVIPFAMANRDALPELCEPRKVTRAIKRWGRRKCRRLNEAQLVYVLRWFGMLDNGEGEERVATPDEYGALLAILIREYGSEPKYWLYDAPLEIVKACLNDIMIKTHCEYEAARKSAAKAGKAIAPDPNSPQVISYTKFIRRLRVYEAKRMAVNAQ